MNFNIKLETREQFIHWFIEWAQVGDHIKVMDGGDNERVFMVYNITGEAKAYFIDGKGLTILY